MARISSKTLRRLTEGLKRFQPVVVSAKSRDLNEADTSRIITDVLAELFGFDKYSEITSEYSIRGTYCDLAIKFNDSPKLLIEVKAVGTDLKDNHVKQAIDYAANQGMDWVVLTNAVIWKVYKIIFGKPVDKEEVVNFDLTALSHKNQSHIEMLHLISKEGLTSSVLHEFHEQKSAINKFTISAVVQTESVLKAVRREVCRLSPEIKVSVEDILTVLKNEVLKREVVESDEAKEANKKVLTGISRLGRAKTNKQEQTETDILAKEAVVGSSSPLPVAAV